MSITGCVLIGLVSGFVANRVVKGSGQGLLMDLMIAVSGAVAGGLLFHRFEPTVVGLTALSVLASVTGAVAMLAGGRAVARFGRIT
jgi:uncharacterized membrane protein YeaQ/YmgE (transglycosylase-associated protein family)